MREEQDQPPVVVIGGGVVGTSMSLALARQGIDSIILERAAGPNDHPRAHVANPRTLEIFRLWGLEPEVRAAGLAEGVTGNFLWMSSLAGRRLGEIVYEHHAQAARRNLTTLTPEVSCAQDRIEEILRRGLQRLTGRRVRYGAGVTGVTHEPDGTVAVQVEDRAQPIRARYAVAADGAGSPTRDGLGIAMEGPEELARFVSIYLHADLSPWVGARPAVLYWIVNSRVQGVFISMDGRSRYVFHKRIDPARESFSDYTPERCRALVEDAVGAAADIDVRKVGQWVMSGQVAHRYRSGNVFLVGDSAHRFPPTGGFGMNTGIQDAHNLAWKLAAVLRGWAPESLLESYASERRPVADMNRSRSVSNFERLEHLASWSSDPTAIIERLEAGGEVAARERAQFAEEIERQRDHFDKLEQELGFVYHRGALADDAGGAGTGTDAGGSLLTETHVLTRAEIGARMPLTRLRRADGSEVGTTDLIERSFVLLANRTPAWNAGVRELRADGLPIDCLEVGADLVDPGDAWDEVSGTSPGGALLARPDGHVAFRRSELPEDPASTLAAAMNTILRGGHEL